MASLDLKVDYDNVKKKVEAGGGWLTWVISTDNIEEIEKALGRKSVVGNRKRPDGSELEWKQIGVLGTLEDRQLPFFIEWKADHHPSTDGKAVSKIVKIEIAGDETIIKTWLASEISEVAKGVSILISKNNLGEAGITSVQLETPTGMVSID